MAIYATPPKSPGLLRRLDELDVLRRYLAQNLGDSAQPWTGALRRLAAAEATVGSTSIEGYGASLEDTVEILAGRHPSGTSEETQRIIGAYAQAMDRVNVLADDRRFQWSAQTILDLHFLVCHPQPQAGPGRFRDGSVIVTRGLGRDPYRPPAASEVPGLVNEVAKWLGSGYLTRHPVVRAAMATAGWPGSSNHWCWRRKVSSVRSWCQSSHTWDGTRVSTTPSSRRCRV